MLTNEPYWRMTADEALSAWHCDQLNILQSLM